MVKLLSIEEFETSAKNAEIDILLDARHIKEFDEQHIPGAMHIPWEEWNEPAPEGASTVLHQPGYWGKLAEPVIGKVAEKLTRRGIHNDSRIVVYADGYRSKGREGRIAWMLLYFGAQNVDILDGGFRNWQKGGLVGVRPNPAARPFELKLDQRRQITKRELEKQTATNAPLLIDTRGSAEFNGLEYDYQPRLGRIPAAVSFPFRQMLRANGHFITKDEYLQIAKKLEIGAKIVWYCEVGVRAALGALLHEIYTGDVSPVYDGSFMEWSFDPALPVECAAQQAPA